MGTAAFVTLSAPIAAAQDDGGVETITVTAQRRAQNLQKVPAAVTALTTKLRDETGIITAQQQMNFTPGVTYNPGFDRVTIRGISRATTLLGTDAGVAVYQDGFYIGSITGIGGSTLGTDRVEVVRGPQGTLYGRNSIGGAVNVISRRPSEDFAFDARTSVNNYGGVTVESRVSGGLTEGLSASLRIGAVEQTEGYYKNVSNDKDEGGPPSGPESSWNVNAQLRFESEDIDAWVSYSTLESETHPRNATGITPYGVPSRGVGSPYVFYGLPADGNPGTFDHRKFRTDRQSLATYDDYHQVIGELVWHGDGFDVKYIGGYRTYDYFLGLDGNATDNVDMQFPYDCVTLLLPTGTPTGNIPFDTLEDCDLTQPGTQRQYQTIHNDITQNATDIRTEYSHEINITSTGDGPLQYIFGAYYFHSDQRQDLDIDSHNEPGNNIITVAGSATPNPSPDKSIIYRYTALLETESKAIFGQLDYDFSDELKATIGLRYSEDEKTGYEENIFVAWLQYGLPVGVTPTFTPVNIVAGTCPQPGSAPPGQPDFYHLSPEYDCPVARDLQGSYDAVTGTAGLEWTPTDDRLIYLKYSRGYKSGGFANLGYALSTPFVDSETVDAYEAGWKEKIDDTLQFNSSFFYYQYHDQQSPVAEIQGTIQVGVLKNLPEVESYGAEIEAVWTPIENLRVLGNYSYLHTEILEGCCYIDVADPLAQQPGAQPFGPITVPGQQEQTLVGNSLAGSPEHKVALNATYTWALDAGELIGSVTWNWKSDSYQTLFNQPQHLIQGGDSTDIRISWNDADSGVSIIGSVTNVFDEEVMSGFFTDSPARLSYQSLYLEPPRIFSLEVRYSY